MTGTFRPERSAGGPQGLARLAPRPDTLRLRGRANFPRLCPAGCTLCTWLHVAHYAQPHRLARLGRVDAPLSVHPHVKLLAAHADRDGYVLVLRERTG